MKPGLARSRRITAGESFDLMVGMILRRLWWRADARQTPVNHRSRGDPNARAASEWLPDLRGCQGTLRSNVRG